MNGVELFSPRFATLVRDSPGIFSKAAEVRPSREKRAILKGVLDLDRFEQVK